MSALAYRERPPAGEPVALLVLHHGRGSDELDLLGLADALDPARRFHIVSPRAPLRLSGSPGYHWYLVPRVGYPDRATFDASYGALAALHDELWQATGLAPAQTVLGGFSMGAVMSYALALGANRPAPAGILALSGFIPTVAGWQPSIGDRIGTRAFVAHGRNDPVIEVAFARAARDTLQRGGLEVEYRESDAGHFVEPADVAAAASWLAQRIDGGFGTP